MKHYKIVILVNMINCNKFWHFAIIIQITEIYC